MKRNIPLTILLAAILILPAVFLFTRRAEAGPLDVQGGLVYAPSAAPRAGASASLSTGFSYQGQLTSGGNPVTDTCDFQFRLWSDAGGTQQVGAVQTVTNVAVSGSAFAALVNTGGEFGASAFDGSDRWLGISVRCPAGSGGYTDLSPVQSVLPTPYAFFAEKTAGYANMLIVAKSGGDYTSIQAAIDSISDAGASNPYLVWVAPGTYTETVILKDYVDLAGAGPEISVITAPGSVSSVPTVSAGGTDSVVVRDLTIENSGGNTNAYAVNIQSGIGLQFSNVHVRAYGGTTSSIGINTLGNGGGTFEADRLYVNASGAGNAKGIVNNTIAMTLTHLTVDVSGCSTGVCYGLQSTLDGSTVIRDGRIQVQDDNTTGTSSAIFSNDSAVLVLEGVDLIASGGTATSAGLTIWNGSADLRNIGIWADNRGLAQNINDAGTYTITLNTSQVTSGSETVRSVSGGTILIGGTLLAGDPVVLNSGTITCAGVWDETYTFFTNTCP